MNYLNNTKYFKGQKPYEGTEKFEDPLFMPCFNSLVGLKEDGTIFWGPKEVPEEDRETFEDVVWKRASEIIEDPILFEDEIKCTDIEQGLLGNCYFLAGIASLSAKPELIYDLFVTKDVSGTGYYEIRLFVNGEWQIVIVDDYIPWHKYQQKPVYSYPKKGQLWVFLLEKAWAKVNNSYRATIAGLCTESFSAMTGFPAATYFINETTNKYMFDYINTALRKGGFACVGSKPKDTQKGIIPGHAYSVEDAFEVKGKSGKTKKVLQLRNPYGKKEFTGSWLNGSFVPDGNEISKEELEKHGLGLFYIPYEDFLANYLTISISFFEFDAKSCQFAFDSNESLRPKLFRVSMNERGNLAIRNCLRTEPLSRQIRSKDEVICVAKLEEGKHIFLGMKFVSLDDHVHFNLEKGEYLIWFSSNRLPGNPREQGNTVRFFCKADYSVGRVDFEGVDSILNSILYPSIKKWGKNQEKMYLSRFVGSPIDIHYYRNVADQPIKLNFIRPGAYNAIYCQVEGNEILLQPEEDFVMIGVRNLDYINGPIGAFGEVAQSSELKERKENIYNSIPKEALKPAESVQFDFLTENKGKFVNKFKAKDAIEYFLGQLKLRDEAAALSLRGMMNLRRENEFSAGRLSPFYFGQVDGTRIPNGIGVYLNQKGTFKAGEYVNGRLTGMGEYYENSKLVYKGTFLNNFFQGEGLLNLDSNILGKITLHGEFENGKIEGNGTCFIEGGQTWVGVFSKGKPYGKGKMFYPDGSMEEKKLNI